eukprot:CAMPEP_0116871250 /NCGR_PEP_ID=MMETSP0463-20121206/1505_1 /TAXON_ID=181622 /ORGANISM="Strombidinopsis sp, Strain SopsisLIS2011" /LENGTH=105 /DNA_ID=CAMNT_0004509293 /DNA_START=213 /DNA_END=530 /DNA_ORIENTATION=+
MTKNGTPFPDTFPDYEILKFIHGSNFDLKKTVQKLVKHLEFLAGQRNKSLTPKSVRLLNSGIMYIHGRDKFFRPTWILDGGIMNRLAKEDPDMLAEETFIGMFWF